MYYVPVSWTYPRTTVNYVPVYSPIVEHRTVEVVDPLLTGDMNRMKRDLADLREELSDLKLEQSISRSNLNDLTSFTYRSRSVSPPPRPISPVYVREAVSPVYYCSVCDDLVTESVYPPPPIRPSTSRESQTSKLSEYVSRQIDLRNLRTRYIPETRPVWIPTAYKNDYPHRRWVTRHTRLSEP